MKKTINTIQGKAEYVKTEVEDKNGNWNDNYYTKDGYYVIHEGNKHHVYKVKEETFYQCIAKGYGDLKYYKYWVIGLKRTLKSHSLQCVPFAGVCPRYGHPSSPCTNRTQCPTPRAC